MFPYFLLGLALLAGLILFLRWFVTAEPKKVVALLRPALIGLGVIVAGYIIYFGGPFLFLAALGTAFLILVNIRAAAQRTRAARGPTAGQSSQIRTQFLQMTLDHDSGEMDGMILSGRFRGTRLSDLDLADLIALWQDYSAQDEESAAVLEAYLDRAQGAEWREAAGQAPGDERSQKMPGGDMAVEEALEILGLEAGASKTQIVEAHRRLMQKIHPDHGGSTYLAAKINQAKDLLLGAG